MNIKTTGYDETGTLFNFDIIVKSNEDFEKVINVLRTFYEIKSQGFMSTKKVINSPTPSQSEAKGKGIAPSTSDTIHQRNKDLLDKDYNVCIKCKHKEWVHTKFNEETPKECLVKGCKCKQFILGQLNEEENKNVR